MNENKNRVIVFFDGSHQIITEAQEDVMFSDMAKSSGGLKIDGNWINLKAVSRVEGLEDFYSHHPEKRPARDFESFSNEKDSLFLKGGWKKENRVSAIQSMINGMKKYISSSRYQGTNGPVELLSQMEQRLSEMKCI